MNTQPCPQSEDLDLEDPKGMNMAGIKVSQEGIPSIQDPGASGREGRTAVNQKASSPPGLNANGAEKLAS